MVPMAFRYDMEVQSETWGFIPDALDASKLENPLADHNGKASFRLQEIGAAWSEDYSFLATPVTRVVWEVVFDRTPPATVRPVKPKVVLTRPVILKRKAVYLLARA